MQWGSYYNNWNTNWNVPFWGFAFMPVIGLFVLALIVWTMYWKGRALWCAARKGDLYWFIALLVINTAGILEILYIFRFSKKTKSKNESILEN
ncbi:MAG: DUF5652 family protein [bacterium]|nr:DUF5652 family protein [bacterium]